MAVLKVTRCGICTKPLAPGVTICPNCKTEHQIVPEVVNPLRFNAQQAADYQAFFENQTKANPNDTNSLFGMGLVYLGLKNYELAQRNFKQAVDLNPADPDMYYYYALSLFSHRAPAVLSDLEAEKIEMWLQTATKIQPKRKYLILQMLLRQGCYLSKGKMLDCDKATPQQLLNQALKTVQEEDELYEIEQHVKITDPQNVAFVEQLRTGKKADKKNKYPLHLRALLAYHDFCDMPKGEDDADLSDEGVLHLHEEEEREAFFNALYPPTVPEEEYVPGYTKPITKSLWRILFMMLGFFVVLIIVAITEFGYSEPRYEEKVTEKEYIADALRTKKKLSQAEINRRRKEAKAEYAEKVVNDSIFYADHWIIGGRYDIEGEDEVIFWGSEATFEGFENAPKKATKLTLFALEKSWRTPVLFLFLLSPFFVWLIMTCVRIGSRKKERDEIKARNATVAAEYLADLDAFHNRPTIFDYMYYCQGVMGPNHDDRHITYGDAVEMALEQAGIQEEDLKGTAGKIFLTTFFFDVDANGVETDNPFTTLQRMGINVSIAMRDRVVLLQGIWETFTDSKPKFTEDSLMYSQIGKIAKESDAIVLHHGGSETVIATSWGRWESLWQYQSDDPTETYTYSETRTTNRDEFYRSLIEMHGRYNKQ